MKTFFKEQYNFKNKTNPSSQFSIKEKTVEDNFSLMIRLRDIYLVVDTLTAYCRCITCQKTIHWRIETDCGHCFTRDKPMTKYNPKNNHAQCHACNRERKGEQGLHILRLIDLYGKAEVDKLEALSKIRGQKDHTTLALYDMNIGFKKEIKRLAKTKGIKVLR